MITKILCLASGVAMTGTMQAKQETVKKGLGENSLVAERADIELKVAPFGVRGEVQVEKRIPFMFEGGKLPFAIKGEAIVERKEPFFIYGFKEIEGTMLPNVYLGVATSKLDQAMASQLDLAKGVGLSVLTVEKGSPAEKAGLQKYDVLYKFEDQLIINKEQLYVLLDSYKPGAKIKLSFFRKGKIEIKEVLLEKSNFLNRQALGGVVHGLKSKPRISSIDLGSMYKMINEKSISFLSKTPKGLFFKVEDLEGKKIFGSLIEPKANWDKIPKKYQERVRKLRKLMAQENN